MNSPTKLATTLRQALFALLLTMALAACTGTDGVIVTNGNTDACGNIIDNIAVLDQSGQPQDGHVIYRLSPTLCKIDDITYTIADDAFQVTKAACKGQVQPVTRLKLNGRTLQLNAFASGAFAGCSEMTAISIPQCVESIGDRAFDGCTSLTALSIPASVQSIGENAFSGCSNLNAVALPSTLKSIAKGLFTDCSALTAITLPSSVQDIAPFAFQGCSSLASVIIPQGVKGIEPSVFSGCKKLSSVSLPESIKEIGAASFQGCQSLAAIALPSQVHHIGDLAFAGCQSLAAITLPDAVLSIGTNAFQGCTALADVYSQAIETPQISTLTFTDSQHETATLHVPYDALDNYKFDLRWNRFKSLVSIK